MDSLLKSMGSLTLREMELEKNEGRVKPSTVSDRKYVYANSAKLQRKWMTFKEEKFGKWLFFFPLREMDAAWARAVKLFESGQLDGVFSMKASTRFRNPRASATYDGVIMFFCGPCDDQETVEEYGKNIMDRMHYDYRHFVPYKTNVQSAKGTIATGQRVNHVYKVYCPTFKPSVHRMFFGL